MHNMDDYQDKDIINDSAKGDDQDSLEGGEGDARVQSGFKSRSALKSALAVPRPGGLEGKGRRSRRVRGDGSQATPRDNNVFQQA